MAARYLATSSRGRRKDSVFRYQLSHSIRIELIGEGDEPGRRSIENYCVIALAVPRLALWLCPPRYFFKQLRYQLCDLILRGTSDLNEETLPGLRPQQPKLNPASMCFFPNCAHGDLEARGTLR